MQQLIDRISFEAALFDLDGVVINSNGPIVRFWRNLAEECGIRLTEIDFLKYIYGIPARDTLDKLFTMLSGAEKNIVMQRLEIYENQLTYTGIPGVIDFLHELRRHNIPTALVTSSKWVKLKTVFAQLNLNGVFSKIITAEDIHRGKPDPECYLMAAMGLNKRPARCIVFEDALSGVKAAVTAGTVCIGVHQAAMSSRLLDAGAATVIPDFTRITLFRNDKEMYLKLGTPQEEKENPIKIS